MLEQRCPAKRSVTQKTPKTDEVKCGLASCSALNIPVVWQWRWWWAKSNWLSLYSTNTGFNPHDFQGPRQPNCLATSLPPSLNANPRLVRTHSRREPTDQRIYRTVERSIWSVSLSVCPSDRSTTLPQLHSQRLQWEITFFGEPHLFFKWPYLSLKKWDIWGQWERECFVFCFLNFLCASLSDLLSSRRHFCHWGHWASVV